MQDYQGGATIKVKQTAYYCTLCKFRGASREELAQHRQAEYVAKTGSVICTVQVYICTIHYSTGVKGSKIGVLKK